MNLKNLLGRFRDPLRKRSKKEDLMSWASLGVPIPQYNIVIRPETTFSESYLENPMIRKNYEETVKLFGNVKVFTDGTIFQGHHPLLKIYYADMGISCNGKPADLHFYEKGKQGFSIPFDIGGDKEPFYLIVPHRDHKIPMFREMMLPEFA